MNLFCFLRLASGFPRCRIAGMLLGFLLAIVAPCAVHSQSILKSTLGKINAFPGQLFCVGDSYIVGIGAPAPTAQGACYTIGKAMPYGTPIANAAAPGATSDTITFDAFAYFSPLPQISSVVLLNGGANDGACGVSAGCLTNYKEELMASEAWLSIPYAFRIMGSAGTGANWATDTSFPSVNPGSGGTSWIASPGVPVSTTTNAASKTFSVPSSASPVVGVTFQVTNSQTGTFTVSVDGVLQTDQCSGTTTFTSAPCSVNLQTQTTTPFRQEFAVAPGQTHTVVIATTNTGKVDILCVDWVPPASTININTVFVANTDAVFANFATYNVASQAVIAQLRADGLPIYLVDLINGTPGVNATTDLATVATSICDGSTVASHPNSQCGYVHFAQTIYNEEITSGYIFSGSPSPQNVISPSGVPQVLASVDLPFQQAAQSNVALFTTPSSGRYRITYYAALSTAATVSSVLGGTTGLSVVYLDGVDFVTRTVTLPEINQSGTPLTVSSGNTTNTSAAIVQGSLLIDANNGNAVTYSFGYTSSGATAMQYQLHIRVEQMF